MNTYRGGTRRRQWRLAAVLLSLGLSACGGPSVAQGEKVVVVGPPTIEVVRVVEQPVNVTLSMPGELTPYQTVAIYPRVTGFIKTIRVDRGSRVRAGELLVLLDAPELAAQRSEAQSKLQSAEAQLGALRSKADADASTYERLKAAAATPGVVAGNDLVLAQKAVEGDQGHMPNIARAFPEWGFGVADGEAVIFRPDGKGGTMLVARVKIEEWPGLR